MLILSLVLGELNAKEEDLTILQKINRKRLRIHLAKINWPRFMYGPLRFMAEYTTCASSSQSSIITLVGRLV